MITYMSWGTGCKLTFSTPEQHKEPFSGHSFSGTSATKAWDKTQNWCSRWVGVVDFFNKRAFPKRNSGPLFLIMQRT